MKRFPFPLQYSIPAILVLLSSISGFYSFRQEVSMADRRVEAQTIRQARFFGSKTSALLEFIYRTEKHDGSDLESANLVVSQMGGDPHLKLAVLLDEHDRIALTTRYTLRGRHLGETQLAKSAQNKTLLAQARNTLAGQVAIAPDRKSLSVFYPVRLQPKSGELRSSRIGVLVLEYDLFAREQRARQKALRRSLRTSVILALMGAIAWFVLARIVTRRATHLVAVSNSRGQGNLKVRAQLNGSDELAQIAVAFNHMADQLQQETHESRKAKREREHAEEALRQVIEGTAAFTGQDFFPALVRHIAEALKVRYVGISEATPQGFQMLAFWANGTLQPSKFFPYSAVPCCTKALQTGQCCVPEAIQELYPDNAFLSDLNVESYLGVGLRTAKGDPIGNLCILHDRPLSNSEWAETFLQIFAARAGAELERYQTSLALETLNDDLERRVQERTDQLRERELQLEDFFDNANDLIQSVTLSDGRFEYVNRVWRETLGYTASEVEQLTIFDILHPSYHEHCRNLIATMLAGEVCSFKRIELTFITKDRQQILVEGSVNCRLEDRIPVATRAIFRDVTERKKAETRLKESELRYASLATISPVGIFRTDADGDCFYVNKRWCEFAGMMPLEAMGKGWMRAIYPADRSRVSAEWYASARERRNFSLEYRFQRPDGKIFWLYAQSGTERDAEGNVTGYVGTLTDIGDRRFAEERVRESQQFLQTVLDTFPLHVFWKDRNSVFLGCNQNLATLAGFENAKALIGKTDDNMPWSKTEADQYRADDREVMQSGTAKLGQIKPILDVMGQQRWLETNKLPLRNLAGEAIGVVGTFQDITPRIQAEQALQKTMQELKAFQAAIDQSAIVAMTDIRGVITAVNDRFCEISGYTRDEVVGQTHRLINSGYHPPEFFKTLWSTISAGKLWRGEICNRAKNGHLYWVDSAIIPFLDEQGKPYQYLAIRFDVTERKQMEVQLQHTNKELIRATRLKDEFLANMSHELRTPLNAILGMTEGLQEQVFGTITEKQNKALQTIERSGSHLLELINEILDLAKIESGQIELNCQPTAIASLCQLSLVFIKQQAHKKRIQVISQLPDDLPKLMIDERRIRQVLINLLNNAVKFTPEGGQITLKVQSFPQPDRVAAEHNAAQLPFRDLRSCCHVRFSVQDTGIGIAPENINKLFKPFIQIDSALNRQYSGTGLGLALVKNIVELHGGEVGLTSEVGVGSCFTFDLPFINSNNMTTKPNIQLEGCFESGQPSAQECKTPLILLAEDNEGNILTISSYLRAKGYEVRLAKNGREALEQVQAVPPDLILMDVQMPEMDGLEAMQTIRQIPEFATLPIIALTALAMAGDKEKCLQAGANDYLSKPVRLKQLATIIQQLLTPPDALDSIPKSLPLTASKKTLCGV